MKLITNIALVTLIGLSIYFGLKPNPLPPQPPRPIYAESHTPEYQTALFEAARVYGRAGCGDESLAVLTAEHSISSGVPARLIAAQVATESNCNPLAISNKGAVGLTQVCPKVWSKQFDFTRVNLLNPNDNMTVYTSILRDLIKRHGFRGALQRYYGTGVDDIGMGGVGYADKVLQLAGKL